MYRSKYFYITLFAALFLGFLPAIVLYAAHGLYPRIPLETVDGTLSSLAQVREIVAKHIFFGNPYLAEHIHDIAPILYVGDWIYALPFYIFSFTKFSLMGGMIASQVLFTLLTAILLYVLYHKISIPERYVHWLTTLSLLVTLPLIIRPVEMSVVYPMFLFFTITLFDWLRQPNGRKETILFVISSALSLYTSPSLALLVSAVLFFTLIYVCWKKINRKEFFLSLAAIIVLSVPLCVSVWKIIHSPLYAQTLVRSGLIATHMLSHAALWYAAVSLISLACLYVLHKRGALQPHEKTFFGLISLALCVIGTSNVVSGADIDFITHVGWFTQLWTTVFISFAIWKSYQPEEGQNISTKRLPLLIGISLLFLFILNILHTNYGILHKALATTEQQEIYMQPITALSLIPTGATPTIILSDDAFASYATALTKDYVVFDPDARSYLVSNDEITERYLVSRMFAPMTEQTLRDEFSLYAGTGPTAHKIADAAYFDTLWQRYLWIKARPELFLNKYNVAYIMLDRFDSWIIPPTVAYKAIGGNIRFTLYKRQ